MDPKRIRQQLIHNAQVKSRKRADKPIDLDDVAAALEKVGLNPIQEMARLVADGQFLNEKESRLHVDLLKELADRVAPKTVKSEGAIDITNRVISAEPMSDDEWADKYSDNLGTPGGPAKSSH